MAANNYSSPQQQQPDDISLFLHQILLPSSSSSQPVMRQPPVVTPPAPPSCGFRMPNSEIEVDDCDYESEEAVEETAAKATLSRSCSKRSRAAEVHNLSEKRRRSRINEKMKALQNLIPNSNKTDKASMLDEAIEYLKQLQLQVQMLTMRNGLSLYPICLPGMPQPNQTQDVYDSDKFLNVNLTKALCMDQNISAPLTDFSHAIGSNSMLDPQSSMQQQHFGALQLTESSKVLPCRPVMGDGPQISSGGVKATAPVPCQTQTSNLKGYSLEGGAEQTLLITQYFHSN